MAHNPLSLPFVRGLRVPKRYLAAWSKLLKPHLFTTQRCKRGFIPSLASDVEESVAGALRHGHGHGDIAGHVIILLKDGCGDVVLPAGGNAPSAHTWVEVSIIPGLALHNSLLLAH
jgi:hypothetical protein